MIKFFATIEFLSGQSAAILTLTNEASEWAGSGRIETRSGLHSDIYEEAYRQASFVAQSKGGRLERFSVADEPFPCDGCPTLDSCLAHERCAFPEATEDTTKGLHKIPSSPDGAVQALAGNWKERRLTCGAMLTPAFQHRPGNALNVEPIQPMPRCLDKKPETWPEGASALRWMASGGEAWVFGPCSSNCPREAR